MKIIQTTPPRVFEVGKGKPILIKDCAKIYLEKNEQVTLITESGREYDVVRKDWGYYATPSLNGRLSNQGFKTALVKNMENKFYIMLVEIDKKPLFDGYLETENILLVEWLDER